MVQQPRRSPRPFVVAILVAVVLIGGLRFLTTRGASSSDDGEVASAGGRCGGDELTLAVTASSEKAQLMKQLATAYTREGHAVDGRCVRVEVTSKASGGAMAALAKGWDEATDGPRPDVWTPASSGWVRLLEQRTLATDRPKLIPASIPKIAASPLVIAMPRPMAQALGWPKKQLGWSDVLELSQDDTGWARHGHPEWGQFRLGKTNPNFSTSGLNATIGAYFAATRLSSDLTEKDLASPKTRKFVEGVERSVVHYGDTTLTFLSNLQRADDQGAGLSYISAVTVEEKSVWDYNQGNPTGDPATLGQHPKPKVPLVAIYPKEGTLLSDHPWVVLTAPWVDDAKRKASADLLAFLQGAEARAKFQEFAFRDGQDKPGPLVNEANGLLRDEPRALLSPPAPRVLDKLLRSWASLRKQATVLLVIDTSGSMGEQVAGTGRSKLELAKQAARNSLSQFASGDQVGLWMFSTQLDGETDYRELVPIGPMDSQRRAQLGERIDGLQPGGGTGLYDTSLAAHQFVEGRASADDINAVVLLTDGRNEDNGISLDNLLSQLRTEEGARSVRLFTIGYGEDADLGTLRQISQTTNAAAYDSSDPTSIDQVFTAVISNF
ncbi:MAG TPA: substrate-binding and VWA domain-containing protein [Actinomycetota bacterium]|nr:substrate-binding and VWA domain-containing protein [Actinomycetota bacterium]